MSLQQEFEAAVQQVNNLPADTAPKHMTDLYGLYKQATEGDVNMRGDAVDADAATQASGPAGLSQAQWDSWDKYKGTSEDDAKRQYVAKVAEITGQDQRAGGDTVTYAKDQFEALVDADALLVVTEWPEFRSPSFEVIGRLLKQKVIFDGRNIYDPAEMKESGFSYHCIGIKTDHKEPAA